MQRVVIPPSTNGSGSPVPGAPPSAARQLAPTPGAVPSPNTIRSPYCQGETSTNINIEDYYSGNAQHFPTYRRRLSSLRNIPAIAANDHVRIEHVEPVCENDDRLMLRNFSKGIHTRNYSSNCQNMVNFMSKIFKKKKNSFAVAFYVT